MFTRTLSRDAQRLPFALQTMLLFGHVLGFADEAAAKAGSGSAANGGDAAQPATAVQAKQTLKRPAIDIDSMSEDEVRAKLAELVAKQGTSREAVRTIRFNDGTDPTFEADGKTVKSARDSGTLSIYGFGRNPISLYANQWLDLLQFGSDIVNFIGEHASEINEYVRQKPGNEGGKRDVNMEAVEQLQMAYLASQEANGHDSQGDEATT